MIDTHCHISKEDYDDIDLIINEAVNSGVDKIIISGCTKDSIVESLEVSSKYPNVYITIGYHPSEADLITDSDLDLLEEQIRDNDIVGIGEIGLDYHYGKENAELQKKLFHKQMVLAEKYHLPVVIHSRDATEDTIAVLKQYPNVIGDIHCFSGSIETAKIYISMGYKIGIGGVITFKNSKKLVEVVENISLDDILLETDSPYLAPAPFRGTKNVPYNTYYIAEKIAEIKNVNIDNIFTVTTQNSVKLFDIKL